MQVSVIIPVYNAAAFIAEAVASALMQPETAEVVLVEDGSPDDSLRVCQELAAKYPDKVKLYQHPNGENRGAGASRNLAIEKASQTWIAFLDADDYFVPNRFEQTKIALQDPQVEGVYEAIGSVIQDDDSWQRLVELGKTHLLETTITERLRGKDLFNRYLTADIGRFSIIGLTIKRSALMRVGGLADNFRFHDDTLLIFKLMATCYLAPGSLDTPVAIRRIHLQNSFSAKPVTKETQHHRELLNRAILEWTQQNLEKVYWPRVRWRYVGSHRIMQPKATDNVIRRGASRLHHRLELLRVALKYPFFLRDRLFWKEFLPDRVYNTLSLLA